MMVVIVTWVELLVFLIRVCDFLVLACSHFGCVAAVTFSRNVIGAFPVVVHLIWTRCHVNPNHTLMDFHNSMQWGFRHCRSGVTEAAIRHVAVAKSKMNKRKVGCCFDSCLMLSFLLILLLDINIDGTKGVVCVLRGSH